MSAAADDRYQRQQHRDCGDDDEDGCAEVTLAVLQDLIASAGIREVLHFLEVEVIRNFLWPMRLRISSQNSS